MKDPHRARAPSALQQYLTEIGRYPLLDRDGEARLAARIREGDEEALHTLVRANLRFVVTVAKRYRQPGLELADLIDEGNLGLIEAAHRFDGSRGTRFVSYAVWWIRQAITHAILAQATTVRVPTHRAELAHRIARHASTLRQRLGRAPTDAEVAASVGIAEDAVARAALVPPTAVSLESPPWADGGAALQDILGDDDAAPVDDRAVRVDLADAVERALGSLAPREREILRLYYGLDGGGGMTLDEIGARFRITRERVRQLRERALRRLRHGAGSGALETLAGCADVPTHRAADAGWRPAGGAAGGRRDFSASSSGGLAEWLMQRS